MSITVVDRPVRRKVTSAYGKKLVATVTPEGLYVREHRRRTSYLLPWGHAFVQAAKLAADRIRAEKAAERKTRTAVKRGR